MQNPHETYRWDTKEKNTPNKELCSKTEPVCSFLSRMDDHFQPTDEVIKHINNYQNTKHCPASAWHSDLICTLSVGASALPSVPKVCSVRKVNLCKDTHRLATTAQQLENKWNDYNTHKQLGWMVRARGEQLWCLNPKNMCHEKTATYLPAKTVLQ